MSWPTPSPSGIRLSHAQRVDWLRLSRTDGVGPLTFNTLINRFGGASGALDALPELLRKQGKGHVTVATKDAAEREIEDAEDIGARFVAMGEPDYPPLLRQIASAPPLLCVMGNAAVFSHPMVAIVGSRNASAAGRSFTERLAKGLTEHGFAIASGLARGIDTRAHEASLGFGTVAVLAGGLAKPYPAENVPLMRRICEAGAIVSEMPLHWEARGRDFPRRNRIISGLAAGTIIVEAARKSGSLITARFALEQNREVFAVPGSPLDPRAEGTNDLLKSSDRRAHMCTSVEDVLAELRPIVSEPDLFGQNRMAEDDRVATYGREPLWDELLLPEASEGRAPNLLFEEDREGAFEAAAPALPAEIVLALLGPSPVEIDELVRLSGLPQQKLVSVLLDLDLAGRIERHGGNRVSLTG